MGFQRENLNFKTINMNQEKFLEIIADQFDETPKSEIKMNTAFKDLDEWDSMIALSVIAEVEESTGYLLSGNEINDAITIFDLYQIVTK
jgi:acyl carrier protein